MSEKSKIFDKIEGDVIASFSGETPNEPSPFEEQIDDEMSIFDYALLENEALSEKEGDAQIQQNEGEPSEQNNAEEKKEEDAKDEKQKDENSERQEQRYGKFKNPEELLHTKLFCLLQIHDGVNTSAFCLMRSCCSFLDFSTLGLTTLPLCPVMD